MLANLRSKRITKFPRAIWAWLVIIAAALLGKWSWDHPSRINITRGEYEQALARWNAQKIEEYDITTDTRAFMGGTMTVHVSAFGNKVEELAPVARPLDTLTTDDIKYLKEDTVEGLFATIGDAFKDNEQIKTSAVPASEQFYMVYHVSFDPRLGYPNHIVGHATNDAGDYLYDSDRDETVTSLKIIKRGK
jgi:hypothetical protein